ncbi:hypothetical protein D3C72_1251650 [compost metagenome]
MAGNAQEIIFLRLIIFPFCDIRHYTNEVSRITFCIVFGKTRRIDPMQRSIRPTDEIFSVISGLVLDSILNFLIDHFAVLRDDALHEDIIVKAFVFSETKIEFTGFRAVHFTCSYIAIVRTEFTGF